MFVLVNSKVLEDAWLGGRERGQNCILAAYTHFLLSGTIGSAGEISLLQPKTDLDEIPPSSSLPSMNLNGNTNKGTELSTIVLPVSTRFMWSCDLYDTSVPFCCHDYIIV